MAEAFQFKGHNSPDIAADEYQEPEGEYQEPKNTPKALQELEESSSSSTRLTSAKCRSDLAAQKLTRGNYDKGEIIASVEEPQEEGKESPQKITLMSAKAEENSYNVLRDTEAETSFELIVIPPAHTANSIPGSFGSRNSPVPEIATEIREESSESPTRFSRMDSAKQDIKNLKSATLGRMGKMFKIRPSTPAGRAEKISTDTELEDTTTADELQYGQNPTRKEKTHSLGRMLRLVDKDGAPRKLFSHPRAGSLTRLRKIHSTVGNVAAGSQEESRNIFTRMLNQFRSRNSSAVNAEPNLQSTNGPTNSHKPSLGTRLMMSLSVKGHSGSTSLGENATADTTVERVAIEYTA